MERRRFDHLFLELSVALGALAPRYALWLRIHEFGELGAPGEPRELDELGCCADTLGREELVASCLSD